LGILILIILVALVPGVGLIAKRLLKSLFVFKISSSILLESQRSSLCLTEYFLVLLQNVGIFCIAGDSHATLRGLGIKISGVALVTDYQHIGIAAYRLLAAYCTPAIRRVLAYILQIFVELFLDVSMRTNAFEIVYIVLA